jgi:putative DNA primase/helicase
VTDLKAGAAALAADAEAAERTPEIEVRDELTPVVDEAVAALAAQGGGGLYVRGGALVRMSIQDKDEDNPKADVQRNRGSLFISDAPKAYVREQADRCATWWKPKYDRSRRKHVKVPALVPPWVAESIVARATWPFPELAGVTATPMLRADGSILDVPGYDEATGYYYAPAETFPVVPEAPTQRDAELAALELCEVYKDFPFVSITDRAAAIAFPLSILARGAIAGPVPMFAFRAHTQGSGKTLLADIGSSIALGHDLARTSPSRTETEEMRKYLLSVAIGGDAAVLFDDVGGSFGSEALDAALTGTSVNGRLLKLNKTATVPLRTVFAITGNNLSFKGALGRRVVVCDIDPKVEFPEDRTGFAHPDLRAWVKMERRRLVAACLTILRAYIHAGRPNHSHLVKGSFEAWDALIRGALIWVCLGDPLGGQDCVRDEGDTDLDALRSGLTVWRQMFGKDAATAAEAIRQAAGDADTKAQLAAFVGCPEAKLDARGLGYALRKHKGRICGGLRFHRNRVDRMSGIRWSVEGEEVTV